LIEFYFNKYSKILTLIRSLYKSNDKSNDNKSNRILFYNNKIMLNIANLNIMSPSSGKFFFTDNNLTLDNHSTTLDDIIATDEMKHRLPIVYAYIETYLNNNSLSNELDILSLEEVHNDATYFRRDMGSFKNCSSQVTKPKFPNMKSWEQEGDYMITYININTIKVLKDYTSEYQGYYNSLLGGNFVSRSGFKYPSRVQIFELVKQNNIFMYIHIHAPGIPDDNVKSGFFSCLGRYISTINNKNYPMVMIGDMNEDDINKIIGWISNPKDDLVAYRDPLDRSTSYHAIINGAFPFNYDYLKFGGLIPRYDEKYELREMDERIYKKVDQLIYTEGTLEVVDLLTMPELGMEGYAPYSIVGYEANSILKPKPELNKEYIPKKISSLDFMSTWNPYLSEYNWLSDHSLMVYRLQFVSLRRKISYNTLAQSYVPTNNYFRSIN
jgi:hypothetical protein